MNLKYPSTLPPYIINTLNLIRNILVLLFSVIPYIVNIFIRSKFPLLFD